MPLPFLVKQRPTTSQSECVACRAVRPPEQLVRCLCGSPICHCGISCPRCAKLFKLYEGSMARYKAAHLHLVCETNLRDEKSKFVDREELVRVFKHLGWLD